MYSSKSEAASYLGRRSNRQRVGVQIQPDDDATAPSDA
jgi:hypothetical protein